MPFYCPHFLNPFSLFLSLVCVPFYTPTLEAQNPIVVFYNVENLFDPADDPKTFDDDYTPQGRERWTTRQLTQKIDQLATVLSKIRTKNSFDLPVLIGLAEVENFNVVQRLATHPKLQAAAYEVLHFNSRDARGIDVALLYRAKHFTPLEAQHIPLVLRNAETLKSYYSRDVLVVQGILMGEEIFLTINHWPSRRGGLAKSGPLRLAAAHQQIEIIDSIYRQNATAKIIVMGDFNDNPTNESLQLLQQPNPRHMSYQPLVSTMGSLFEQGAGSLAYNDRWYLFDQFLWSPFWFSSSVGLTLESVHIFHPKWLYTSKGRYKGYPYRTSRKGPYLRGYSDHFPIYAVLQMPEVE